MRRSIVRGDKDHEKGGEPPHRIGQRISGFRDFRLWREFFPAGRMNCVEYIGNLVRSGGLRITRSRIIAQDQ